MACIVNNGTIECMPLLVMIVLTVACTIVVAYYYHKYEVKK